MEGHALTCILRVSSNLQVKPLDNHRKVWLALWLLLWPSHHPLWAHHLWRLLGPVSRMSGISSRTIALPLWDLLSANCLLCQSDSKDGTPDGGYQRLILWTFQLHSLRWKWQLEAAARSPSHALMLALVCRSWSLLEILWRNNDNSSPKTGM